MEDIRRTERPDRKNQPYDGSEDYGERPEWLERRFPPWRRPWGRPVTWDASTLHGLDGEREIRLLLDSGVLVEGSSLRLLSVFLGPAVPSGFKGLRRLCPAGVKRTSKFDVTPTNKAGAIRMREVFQGLADKLRDIEARPAREMINVAGEHKVAFWSFDEEPRKGFPEDLAFMWVQMAEGETPVEATLGFLPRKDAARVQRGCKLGYKIVKAVVTKPGFVRIFFKKGEEEVDDLFFVARAAGGDIWNYHPRVKVLTGHRLDGGLWVRLMVVCSDMHADEW